MVAFQISPKIESLYEGALGFSVLRIWPILDSVFRFSLLKIAVFRFWCLVRFAGFLQFNLWFSVFVKMMAVFRILLPNSFYGFSGFAKEVTHTLHSR